MLALDTLNLSGTQIEDASLEALSVLANLKELRRAAAFYWKEKLRPWQLVRR